MRTFVKTNNRSIVKIELVSHVLELIFQQTQYQDAPNATNKGFPKNKHAKWKYKTGSMLSISN